VTVNFLTVTCCSTVVVYYEPRKRELNIRRIYECQCDERLKTKTEGSTRLVYTGLCEGLEYLKIGAGKVRKINSDVLHRRCQHSHTVTGPSAPCKVCCLLLNDKARAKDKTYI
jgi:hypothetical protein